MDAQGSTLGKLKHQMNADQKKLKEYEDTVPKLESELSSLKEALETTRQTLEERTVALSQARKHLKNSRERNMVPMHALAYMKHLDNIIIQLLQGVREGNGEI